MRRASDRRGLSRSTTLGQFDNGYWYASELRAFARRIGIAGVSRLRKDELEGAVRRFLQTGEVTSPPPRRPSTTGVTDVERGLRLDLTVSVYRNDRETKEFLEREAQKLAPGLRRKSGALYRLNRWREEQLGRGVGITYADLVREYVRLCQTEGPFPQVPHGRYINFVSDFLAAEKGATREQAVAAWHELKRLDAPKTYRAWVRWRDRATARADRGRRSGL